MSVFELIAHRGASGYAPENTMAAFRKALDLEAASIELDVQQTKDRRLVVIHDTNLRRVARASRKVRDMAWEELSKADVGAWFGRAFVGERVPLLEEALDLADGKSELQLELKNDRPFYPGIEECVVGLLSSRPSWRGKVCVSSFNHRTLRRVRALDARIRLGYLVGLTRRRVALKEAEELGCESVHVSLRRADKAWAGALKAAGMRMLVYTVNTVKDLDRVKALGAGGAFTNFPDLGKSRIPAAGGS